jgi:hypothetical protein
MKKLEPLINAKKKDQKLIIKNRNLINLVCQGVYNILHGTVPINKETKQKLKRFRSKLHALCDTNHTSKQKYKILNQTGGLLGAVVTGLISEIPALISAFS